MASISIEKARLKELQRTAEHGIDLVKADVRTGLAGTREFDKRLGQIEREHKKWPEGLRNDMEILNSPLRLAGWGWSVSNSISHCLHRTSRHTQSSRPNKCG